MTNEPIWPKGDYMQREIEYLLRRKMTWEEDKKAILSRMVDIYQGVANAPNRYEAGKVVFAEFEFFTGKFFSDDSTITAMLQVDNQFVDKYLDTMSELIGEEI